MGKFQFEDLVMEKLVERTKPVDDHRNKLKGFGQPNSRAAGKGKQLIKSMMNDVGLFSPLYISCQYMDGNVDELPVQGWECR